MKIVIAPDSFKGSMTAVQAAEAIKRGVNRVSDKIETVLVPCADGGEGTVATLVAATNGKTKIIRVTGPLGESVEAAYGLLHDNQTCVIEMAAASGIDLLLREELDPFKTTTYGVGELIKAALDEGLRSFIIAIGGSATNDGGAGMLEALGAKITDSQGKIVSRGGGGLADVANVDLSSFDSRIEESQFIIASDVQNPFVGPNGASHVFGPQKGAGEADVRELDANLTKWADVTEKETGFRLHEAVGAGAAGGLGGALLAYLHAEMQQGAEVITNAAGLHEALHGADIAIAGEGQVDFQTAYGKTPMGIAKAAQKQQIPTIIIAGSVGKGIDTLYEYGVQSVHSMINGPMTLDEAIEDAEELMEDCAEQIIRTALTFSSTPS
ncbi:glycerate kinase [Alteribacillus sp. HJP-4]|uniref:glycerate kinase n=1 Tax=Alteribacillus sp. HJP-4 TaxID=2775394 RepID=UPI0035CD10AB